MRINARLGDYLYVIFILKSQVISLLNLCHISKKQAAVGFVQQAQLQKKTKFSYSLCCKECWGLCDNLMNLSNITAQMSHWGSSRLLRTIEHFRDEMKFINKYFLLLQRFISFKGFIFYFIIINSGCFFSVFLGNWLYSLAFFQFQKFALTCFQL